MQRAVCCAICYNVLLATAHYARWQFRDFCANLNICNLFLQMAALEQTRDMAKAHLRHRDRPGPATELTVPAPRLGATNKFVRWWARRRARGVRCTPLSFL